MSAPAMPSSVRVCTPPRPKRKRAPIPAVRRDMIEFAKINPDVWFKYEPGDRETVSLKTLRHYVTMATGGFEAGFHYALRDGGFYVCYSEPEMGFLR